MKHSLGRYVYGLAVIACGVFAMVWHNFDALADVPHRGILTYFTATIIILGGAAVLWSKTVRAGAVALGAVYLGFALLGVPLIVEHPLVYNGFGNFFEQLSYVSSAVILYACFGSTAPAQPSKVANAGYYAFAICVVSFGLEQLFYLPETASFVPKWLPPGQMFWAIATTIAFGLAAIALLTGFMALLASRLNTAMLLVFGLLVWLPALLGDPHSSQNWAEGTETLAIAASAWVVADFISLRRSVKSATASLG